MVILEIALAVLLVVSAKPEAVMLTPDTIAGHGYHMRCVVVDQAETTRALQTRPTGPSLVHLRFGRLPGTSSRELEAIKAVSIVVRDGDAVTLDLPVRAEVDPGNRVHLYVRFSVNKELLSKMQLVFDEDGERGRRTFLADLKPFME